jgi:hypothetical protein
LNVMINTNRAGTTEYEENHIIERLDELINTLRDFPEMWDDLIIMHEGEPLRVIVHDHGIEVGERYHRVHAHFVVRIIHNGRVNIGPMYRRWQQVLAPYLADIAPNGINMRIDLMDTTRDNYFIKDAEDVEDVVGLSIQ